MEISSESRKAQFGIGQMKKMKYLDIGSQGSQNEWEPALFGLLGKSDEWTISTLSYKDGENTITITTATLDSKTQAEIASLGAIRVAFKRKSVLSNTTNDQAESSSANKKTKTSRRIEWTPYDFGEEAQIAAKLQPANPALREHWPDTFVSGAGDNANSTEGELIFTATDEPGKCTISAQTTDGSREEFWTVTEKKKIDSTTDRAEATVFHLLVKAGVDCGEDSVPCMLIRHELAPPLHLQARLKDPKNSSKGTSCSFVKNTQKWEQFTLRRDDTPPTTKATLASLAPPAAGQSDSLSPPGTVVRCATIVD